MAEPCLFVLPLLLDYFRGLRREIASTAENAGDAAHHKENRTGMRKEGGLHPEDKDHERPSNRDRGGINRGEQEWKRQEKVR